MEEKRYCGGRNKIIKTRLISRMCYQNKMQITEASSEYMYFFWNSHQIILLISSWFQTSYQLYPLFIGWFSKRIKYKLTTRTHTPNYDWCFTTADLLFKREQTAMMSIHIMFHYPLFLINSLSSMTAFTANYSRESCTFTSVKCTGNRF